MNHKNLGYLFRLIHNELEKYCNAQLEPIGLTTSQMAILNYLQDNNQMEIHQIDLQKHLKLSNPTVTGLINRMEQKGLIRREASTAGRQFNCIVLTPKSQQLQVEMQKSLEHIQNKIVQDLKQTEIDQLEMLLHKVLRNISEQ